MMDDGGRVMQITSNGSDNTGFSGFSWQGLCGAASTAPTPVMLVNKLILFHAVSVHVFVGIACLPRYEFWGGRPVSQKHCCGL